MIENNGWIDVNVEMPVAKKGQAWSVDVLTYWYESKHDHEFKVIKQAYNPTTGWWYVTGQHDITWTDTKKTERRITHWQHLPEAPILDPKIVWKNAVQNVFANKSEMVFPVKTEDKQFIIETILTSNEIVRSYGLDFPNLINEERTADRELKLRTDFSNTTGFLICGDCVYMEYIYEDKKQQIVSFHRPLLVQKLRAVLDGEFPKLISTNPWNAFWNAMGWKSDSKPHGMMDSSAADPKMLTALRPNHAGALVIESTGKTINYGVIRIEDGLLTYYTGSGLKSIWSPKMNDRQKKNAEKLKKLSEAELIGRGFVSTIELSDINRVIF